MGTHELTVTVLGCDGSYPSAGGACSGYLLRFGETSIWMDAGSGTMAHLQEHISLTELDAVVISHAHQDHWSDLELLAVAYKWGLDRSGLRVVAPRGLRELVRIGSAIDVFDWCDIDEGAQISVNGVGLGFFRTDHPVPTFAVRVDAGDRSLGYSADSGPAWSIESLGPGIDLALCEATFLSDKEGTMQHLSARQAGRSAADAGASRLVITHLMPGVDRNRAREEAAMAFGTDVEVATIGVTYQV